MSLQPFQIQVEDALLDDLKRRLSRSRFLSEDGDPWGRGTDAGYLRQLCDYWLNGFDWREQERGLNSFSHFRSDGGLHFIHERGHGRDPIPLLLLHGWPDSFTRFLEVIPLLTRGEPSFDVVVPSLPGFGFSARPRRSGETFHFADQMHQLMVGELGYSRFAVQGGDWGGMVAEHLARSYASSLVGLHLTDVPFFHMFQKPWDASAAEKRYLKKMQTFQQKEGAYALIQSTRPSTLASGLNDSPAGLAAWIVDKFRAWSDCDGEIESRFSRDQLLTNIMIYWVTQTIDSSFAPYFDLANAGPMRWIAEGVKGWIGSTEVPASFALFPKDLVPPPREWAERFFNVQSWTAMPRGGHFAALEEPQLFAESLRASFASARPEVEAPSAPL